MSEVLLGKHVFSVLHYSKTHFVPVDGRLTEMLFPKHKVCFRIVCLVRLMVGPCFYTAETAVRSCHEVPVIRRGPIMVLEQIANLSVV